MPANLLAEACESAKEKGVGDIVLYPADLFAVSEAGMRIHLSAVKLQALMHSGNKKKWPLSIARYLTDGEV
jgi:hypothetical protein